MKLIKIKCNTCSVSRTLFCEPNKLNIFHIDLENVCTIEDKQYVSWFYHDIYKKNIDHVYIDIDDPYLKPYVHTSDLYDLNKLNNLTKEQAFINQEYSFFNYGYVYQLLNRDTDSELNICGLFK